MPKKYNDKAETAKWNKVNANLHKVNEKDVIKRQVATVMKNVEAANIRKVIASIALCRYYSGIALENFRRFQTFNTFWNNQTFVAYNEVFSSNIATDSEIGFFIAHNVKYGIYLELANDRKHEALWPVIRDLDSEFEIALRKLWE